MWRIEGPQSYESDKIAALVIPYLMGKGLDLGVGLRKVWPHVIGVDNLFDYKGMRPEPVDIVSDCDKLPMFADVSMDFVFSSHLLEHFKEEEVPAILNEWARVIKPGGHLVLYVPSANHYPHVGEDGANPDHKWNIYPGDIERKLKAATTCGWTQLECEERCKKDDSEYSILEVYKKREDGVFEKNLWQRNPGGKKRCLVVRYGAIGDHVMAASILPGLKKQGYFVTYNTTFPTGKVMENNPNIDEFLLQEKDQVPNMQLGAYWECLKERYDKIVNLCETCEGSLLAFPGRPVHALTMKARDTLMGNVNYTELQHDQAEVPYDFAVGFFPTGDEVKRAKAVVNAVKTDKNGNIEDVPVILWAITGSAPHKAYPYTDIVLAWLLEKTPAHIFLTGDKGVAFDLQEGILKNLRANGIDMSRLHPVCGLWELRDSLTIAEEVDCVVGPETGMLNSVSMLDIPKVIYLSHSSETNLTKHWKNTTVLTPMKSRCPCHPCHMLHYDWNHCVKDEKTQAALCASSISPEDVFKAIVTSILPKQPVLVAAE